jgi:hypothetical protein
MDANTRRIRRKGHNWEKAVQKHLARIFGDGGVKLAVLNRKGGATPDVLAPGMWVECKAHRLTNPRGALRHIAADARSHRKMPLAVCKDDRDPPHVTMYLHDFLELLATVARALKKPARLRPAEACA